MTLSRWKKLNHLVPEPKCMMWEDDNRELQIIEWKDVRQRPSDAQIDAVTEQEVNEGEKDKEVESVVSGDKHKKFILEICLAQENRIRALEGSPALTKAQYRKDLKDLYKGL